MFHQLFLCLHDHDPWTQYATQIQPKKAYPVLRKLSTFTHSFSHPLFRRGGPQGSSPRRNRNTSRFWVTSGIFAASAPTKDQARSAIYTMPSPWSISGPLPVGLDNRPRLTNLSWDILVTGERKMALTRWKSAGIGRGSQTIFLGCCLHLSD